VQRQQINDRRICIISAPISTAFLVPLSNLEKISSSLSQSYVIFGASKELIFKGQAKSHIIRINHDIYSNIIIKILNYLLYQMKVSYNLLYYSKNISVCLFFLQDGLLLPMLISRLLRKKVIWMLPSSNEEFYKHNKSMCCQFLIVLQRFNYFLSNRIVIYSQLMINNWGLTKYEKKIIVSSEHLLDFDNFKYSGKVKERPTIIGYVGRISPEKGVCSLAKAIPIVLKKNYDIKFLIGGDGELADSISRYLRNGDLLGKAQMVGWVPHENLPHFLTNLRLIVIPSYTEGLPNIMLEAMACGTPVLATPVGAIPDIITDGETGFLMENNSPECIAANIIRAIEHPNLDGISQSARALVEREFSYEAVVGKWRRILS
jgi:glycosyltransferase involved in cell wall biosynthesis